MLSVNWPQIFSVVGTATLLSVLKSLSSLTDIGHLKTIDGSGAAGNNEPALPPLPAPVNGKVA